MIAEPIRVVIDTSVFVRYLIRPSAAIRRLVEELWLDDQVRVVSAPEMFDELAQVLEREKLLEFIHPLESQALLEVLQVKAEFIQPLGEIPAYTRDPKDDKFVACAVAAQVSYLITEDRDLLALCEISGVHVLTPYHFLGRI